MLMDWRRSLDAHLGISPRRLERLVVVAWATLLLILVVALMVVLALAGGFGRHAPRLFYYFWLVGLILAGLALAPKPGVAAIPLALAALDLGLGAGSLALERAGFGYVSMMPPQFNTTHDFRWHPLLQGEPTPSITRSLGGLSIAHSSAGTRGRDRTPSELATKRVVATFGGSTTYDLAVGDGQTWPEKLEQTLGVERWAVINHGAPGYSTVENLLQTAFYADSFGRRPDCALYYAGWNDLRSSGLPTLDPAYTTFHLRAQVDALKTRRINADTYTVSPTLTILLRSLAIAVDTIRPVDIPQGEVIEKADSRLEQIVVNNVQAISGINRARGIRTLWVGQLLNVAALVGDEPLRWTPLIRQKDLWPLQRHLNLVVRQQAEALGDRYIDMPVEKFAAADFADVGHFSPAGSAKFAELLAPAVRASCQ
jgi:lysophospholipase L1-like esterase